MPNFNIDLTCMKEMYEEKCVKVKSERNGYVMPQMLNNKTNQ